MANPEALYIGLGIGGMFIAIAMLQTIGRQRSKTWDGLVVDKNLEQKQRKRNYGNAEDDWESYSVYSVIIRSEDGKFRTVTNQHEVGAGATWGMFWGLLFGILFFVPVFGLALGAAFGALGGKLAKDSISKDFQDQVRSALQPGTSALFMIVEQMTTDKALDGLSKFGGNVIKTSLSDEDEAEIQAHLHGAA